METLVLNAVFRGDTSKKGLKQARRAGQVPASVFGRGAAPVSVGVSIVELAGRVKESKSGLNALFDLKISGAPTDSDGPVIVKTIHKDAVSRKVLDIEFQRIKMDEKVTINVPVVLLGIAEGTKHGGILEEGLSELHVRCLPGNIPSKIEVDVSDLDVGHHISVGDLTFAEGLEVLNDVDSTVCTCVMSHAAISEGAEAEEAAAAAPAPAPAE